VFFPECLSNRKHLQKITAGLLRTKKNNPKPSQFAFPGAPMLYCSSPWLDFFHTISNRSIAFPGIILDHVIVTHHTLIHLMRTFPDGSEVPYNSNRSFRGLIDHFQPSKLIPGCHISSPASPQFWEGDRTTTGSQFDHCWSRKWKMLTSPF